MERSGMLMMKQPPTSRYNSIVVQQDFFAIGGIYNIDVTGYPTQSSPCWVMLTIFDFNLNIIKQYYYGNGIYAYYGSNIISTYDGGFAVTGTFFDPQNTTNPQPDIFVLKVNSEGLITGNNEIESPQMTEVII